MGVGNALGSVIRNLSDENYTESFASYRLWSDIGETYYRTPPSRSIYGTPPSQTFDVIWDNRAATGSIDPGSGQLIHSTAHLILRFARDAESDHVLARRSSGLQSSLRARSLQEFFSHNVKAPPSGWGGEKTDGFHADANFIAHWANLGYIEEAAIHNHILQSLISHPQLGDRRADALIILFKLAGATFEAYADPSVVDRCFELLKHHYDDKPTKKQLVQVCKPRVVNGAQQAKPDFQEVVALRERRWEGLPPPPVFTTKKPKPIDANEKDPAATPVAASLGLPNSDPEPQIPQPPPQVESVLAPETDVIPASPITPATQSPSTSIAALSDFTIADTSDGNSSIDPTITDIFDDEPPTDPTTTAPHGVFYLEDGNVEVLCENTLFRVHTSTLSFHSPALRRMFAKENLATAESPNGCPRILSSDMAKDFATLLKVIYLPEFVTLPTYRLVVPLIIYLQIP